MKSLAKKLIASLLTVEARLVLFRYRPKIVAITGSVGKTATKDAVYTVLKEIMSVRKSAKSFNSELGIPLTILGVEESGWGSASRWFSILCGGLIKILYAPGYPEWLVLEAGVDRPYDMARLTRWLSPGCVVITRFADVPVHLEVFSCSMQTIQTLPSLYHRQVYACAHMESIRKRLSASPMQESSTTRRTRCRRAYRSCSRHAANRTRSCLEVRSGFTLPTRLPPRAPWDRSSVSRFLMRSLRSQIFLFLAGGCVF